MFGLFFNRLSEGIIEAAAHATQQTMEMETEDLHLRVIVDSEQQIVATEAYARGLIDAFTVGVMAGVGVLDIDKLEHLQMAPRQQKIYQDALPRVKHKFVQDQSVRYLFEEMASNVKMQCTPEKLFVRLDAAAPQETGFFNIGVDDGMHQVDVARKGHLEPTKSFHKMWQEKYPGQRGTVSVKEPMTPIGL